MRFSRRNLLLGALAGGAATFAGFQRGPNGLLVPASAAPPSTIDAYAILQNAIRARRRIVWGGAPAYAAPANTVAVITIKVMNHICPPLLFRLGQFETPTGNTTTGPQSYDNASGGQQGGSGARLTDAKPLLMARGLSEVAPEGLGGGRYRQLRFNRWFANILHTGKVEGPTGTDILAQASLTEGASGDVNPFPTDVAIQAVLGVYQSVPTSNHDFNNCCITGSSDPKKGGDLSFHISEEASGLVPSPLGAVCFNMGKGTETENGSPENRVLRSDTTSAAFGAKSVDTYVNTIKQATSIGIVSLIDNTLVQEFDKLANPPVNFAKEIEEKTAAIKALESRLNASASLEAQTVALGGFTAAERGGVQTLAGSATAQARTEFLAQCKFVQTALDIDGLPFRNFTLFNHASDIDGTPFDQSITGAANEGLSYIESMRQLAVGLNMIANGISRAAAKGISVYAVVVSEGGRDFSGSDNDVGVSLILGPKGTGDLTDRLYAPNSHSGASNAFVSDPGNDTADFSKPGGRLSSSGLIDQVGGATSGTILSEDGTASSNKVATNNTVLIGLIRHIEKRKGLTTSTTTGLGRYLRIETA